MQRYSHLSSCTFAGVQSSLAFFGSLVLSLSSPLSLSYSPFLPNGCTDSLDYTCDGISVAEACGTRARIPRTWGRRSSGAKALAPERPATSLSIQDPPRATATCNAAITPCIVHHARYKTHAQEEATTSLAAQGGLPCATARAA